jgi:hypothetical protein
MKYKNRYTGHIVTLVRCEQVNADGFDKPTIIVNVLSDGTRWNLAQFQQTFHHVEPTKGQLDTGEKVLDISANRV